MANSNNELRAGQVDSVFEKGQKALNAISVDKKGAGDSDAPHLLMLPKKQALKRHASDTSSGDFLTDICIPLKRLKAPKEKDPGDVEGGPSATKRRPASAITATPQAKHQRATDNHDIGASSGKKKNPGAKQALTWDIQICVFSCIFGPRHVCRHRLGKFGGTP